MKNYPLRWLDQAKDEQQDRREIADLVVGGKHADHDEGKRLLQGDNVKQDYMLAGR